MYKALMTKEWMKTRRALIVCLCVALFFTIYALLGINRVTATHGVEHIWLIMLMKDQTFIDAIKYVPLLCGLIIGLAHMMPEMQLYRLKLTLHLPVPVSRLLLTMLGCGLLELTLIFLIMAVAIACCYAPIITGEMTTFVLLSTIPWFLAGYTAYLFAAAICLEGRWKRRILLALIAAALICVYFFQSAPGAYNGFAPWAAIFTLLLVSLSFASVYRFKQGMID